VCHVILIDLLSLSWYNVDFVNTLCNVGYPFTKSNFLDKVIYDLDLDNRVKAFKDNNG